MEIFGWGKKNTADVTEKGELRVIGAAQSAEDVAALEGCSYAMDIDGIQTDGAAYWLAIIKNGHSIQNMIISGIEGWVSSFSNTQIYECVIGQTFAYATNGTEVVPVNEMSGITGGALGDFYVNDTSGNITTIGGTGLVVSRFIFSTTPITWHMHLVVPPNQTMMLRSDLAEKLSGTIHFFYI